MGDRRASVLRDLEAAQAGRAPVRLHRARRLERLEGYVVARGDGWVLVARLVEGLWWHGWTAVRLRDVRRVDRLAGADVVEQMLRVRGQWPPAAPGTGLDLSAVAPLLASAGRAGHLVTVRAERDDDGTGRVGLVHRVGRRTVRLVELTPRARWRRAPAAVALAAVTRVDVASAHAAALRSVAGPPPPWRPADTA